LLDEGTGKYILDEENSVYKIIDEA
jgi:hypothetical protein